MYWLGSYYFRSGVVEVDTSAGTRRASPVPTRGVEGSVRSRPAWMAPAIHRVSSVSPRCALHGFVDRRPMLVELPQVQGVVGSNVTAGGGAQGVHRARPAAACLARARARGSSRPFAFEHELYW